VIDKNKAFQSKKRENSVKGNEGKENKSKSQSLASQQSRKP
jgi:hypothetical protein